MTLDAETSTLLLVDFQERLMPAIAEVGMVTANARRLADAARLLQVPILATEQNPEGLGPTAATLAGCADKVLAKTFFDATREAAWDSAVPVGSNSFVVAGCEAHVCVLQTVLGLLGRGASVALVRDAVGSRHPQNRDAALARAAARGAELVTTEMAIFEWLGSSDHPRFREVLKLVK